MATRKKNPFPIDTSCFSPEQEEKDRAVEQKQKRRKEQKRLSLEEVLLAAKELGLTLVVPSYEEEKEKKVLAKSTLGFVEESTVEVSREDFKDITITLRGSHNINGQVYGPGPCTFSYLEKTLARELLKQDQTVYYALMDTSAFAATTRGFFISSSDGRGGGIKKVEVGIDRLSEVMAIQDTLSVGKIDSAGYIPTQSTVF